MARPRISQAIRQDLGIFLWSLRLVYAAVPRSAAAYAAITLVEALLPAGTIWLLKQIIDTVALATRAPALPTDTTRLALLLAGSYLLLVCLQQSLAAISRLIHGHIYDLLVGHMTLRLMERTSAYQDLTPFESPRFYDRLQLLQQEVSWRPMELFSGLTQGVQAVLTLLCMLFFLGRFHPALVLVIGIAAGPNLFCQRRLQMVAWYGLLDLLPVRRLLADYSRVLLTAPFAKEVRLFGFSEYILGRYRAQWGELIHRVRQIRWRMAWTSVGLTLLAVIGVGGAFAYVIRRALRGEVTLGDLSLYTGALFQASSAASSLTGSLGRVHETLPFMRELLGFLDSKPTLAASPPESTRVAVPRINGRRRTRPGFRLERVAFQYPECERPVFESLDLTIPWGKTTALVGENGAGKSTIVKLLTRLHNPVSGRILLNGVDLREYDLDDLRRQMTVVFQDFCRYPLPVWENISLGDVSRLHDRDRISKAARDAGADSVIRRLPQGEETLLGKQFEGGVDLSGGEWQKIALARAFMRDAPILILDEPTAALDPRSEYDLYRRFTALAAGRTTLLISHRFSTVRMADRIIVLEDGQVLEEGDHAALIARGGRYAELYTMQAERYGLITAAPPTALGASGDHLDE
jgi:ATP-binding cassette subfamily B protein